MSSAPRRGLGRGLEVLIGGAEGTTTELAQLPVDAIHANPRQPRRRFEPEATTGLAEAPSHGLPAIAYDRSSAGADAYWKVAMELVERS